MGRLERVLLVAFAMVVLSVAPGSDLDAQGGADPSAAAVSDPSQQLSSGAPAARGDHSRTAAADVGGRCDRVDPRARWSTVAVLPAVEMASWSLVDELVDVVDQSSVGVVATCASGRGPPSGSAQTSI